MITWLRQRRPVLEAAGGEKTAVPHVARVHTAQERQPVRDRLRLPVEELRAAQRRVDVFLVHDSALDRWMNCYGIESSEFSSSEAEDSS